MPVSRMLGLVAPPPLLLLAIAGVAVE